jgi:HPt (histidine-containing phosphotransfer) domain-containing protein
LKKWGRDCCWRKIGGKERISDRRQAERTFGEINQDLEQFIMETIQSLNLAQGQLEQQTEELIDADFKNPQQELEESVLDQFTLQAIREMGGEEGDFVLSNIIQMYLETAPPYLQQIETAIATQDLDSLRRAAHSLGSSSATLGAMNFAKLCKELENLARSSSITTAETLFFPLQSEYEIVKRALTLQLGEKYD